MRLERYIFQALVQAIPSGCIDFDHEDGNHTKALVSLAIYNIVGLHPWMGVSFHEGVPFHHVRRIRCLVIYTPRSTKSPGDLVPRGNILCGVPYYVGYQITLTPLQ